MRSLTRPAVRAIAPARGLATHTKPGQWVGYPPRRAEEVYPELQEAQEGDADVGADTTAVELQELQGQGAGFAAEPVVMTRNTPPSQNPRAIPSGNPNRPNWYFHRRQKPKKPAEYPGMFGYDPKPRQEDAAYPPQFEDWLRAQELPPRPPRQQQQKAEGEEGEGEAAAPVAEEELEPELFVSSATRQYSVARYRDLRISPDKLNEIMMPLRGLSVQEALNQLRFSHNPKAVYVRNSIHQARANAVNNFQMNPDRLYVYRAMATKAAYRKKIDYKARGRFGIRNVYAAHMTIVLKEMEQTKIKGTIPRYHEVRIGTRTNNVSTTHARLERVQQKIAEAAAIKEKLAQAVAAAAQPDMSHAKATA